MKAAIDLLRFLFSAVLTGVLTSCSNDEKTTNKELIIDLDKKEAVELRSDKQAISILVAADVDGQLNLVIFEGNGPNEIYACQLSLDKKQAQYTATSNGGESQRISDDNFDGVPNRVMYIGKDGNVHSWQDLEFDLPGKEAASNQRTGD